MAIETLSWADLSIGTDQQLADFNGISWTSDSGAGAGSGSVVVKATLLPGSDVYNNAQINSNIQLIGGYSYTDAQVPNTGELLTVGNYAGGIQNSALMLRNIEGDSVSGTGDTETVSLQLDFTTNDIASYHDGVDSVSFWINNIDTSVGEDQVEIYAYDINGVLLPTSAISFSNIGSNVSVNNSGVPALINSNGADIGITDAAGALQITIDDPSVAVGHVVVVYSNLSTGGQLISVSDLTVDTLPIVPFCFTTGTLILTENGEIPVEDLVEGDLIVTSGHGLRPVRWVGKRTVNATGAFAPVCIAKGALGNARDLLVSPEHRMVITDVRITLLFAEDEVLVPAKGLIDGDRIYRRVGGEITYFHILLDAHEVIFAEGAPTESLFLSEDDSSLSSFTKDGVSEALALFPELNGRLPKSGDAARPILNMAEAQLLKKFSR